MIKFGYERQESSLLGVIFRPIAEIYIKKKGEEKWYRVLMIIDSGADVTLLPSMYAGILGVDLNECKKQKTRGIGGFAYLYLLVACKTPSEGKGIRKVRQWEIFKYRFGYRML